MGQRVFGDEIISKPRTFKMNAGNKGKTGEKAKTGISSFNLSEKEIEIIKLVANGLSNKEISETLILKRRHGAQLHKRYP
jgi:DNA-binding NarL/FixJ family response regulator